MKDAVRDLTKKLGIYHTVRRVSDTVKWSRTFEYVYDATHPDMRRAKRGELELFRSLVPSGCLCFDVGANIGDKTRLFVEHDCRVIAAEPVPRNIEILRRRFGRDSRVTLVETAVSDKAGTATLSVTDDNTSFSTFSGKWVDSLVDPGQNRWGLTVKPPSSLVVATTTLDLLIEKFGIPHYIKVDVEGHEINVLRGLSKKVSVLSFEANLPEFLDETQACVETLSALGGSILLNYTTERQDRLELAQWADAASFRAFISTTDVRFLEIYCKMS